MSLIAGPGRFGGVGGDPFRSSVVLMCHFDAADGTNAFVDSSPVARSLFALNGVQHDTGQSKFGGSSCQFDGSSDRLYALDSADWHFGTGAFTIELFARHLVKTNLQTYVTQWNPNSWAFYIEAGNLKFRAVNPSLGTTDLDFAFVPTLGQWYHLCAERDTTGKMRLYRDGVMVASHATSLNFNFQNTAADMTIGAIGSGGAFPTYDFNGHIDELRITKGVARYATDVGFQVPYGPFLDF